MSLRPCSSSYPDTLTLDVDVEKAKALFDVNFWGVLSCIQAFATLLIAAKGTIVNIGSIQSVLNMPYTSIYSASKAATSNFDEILIIEMAPIGVKVVTLLLDLWQRILTPRGVDSNPSRILDMRRSKVRSTIWLMAKIYQIK
jgi:short-subunit dehydrogenase